MEWEVQIKGNSTDLQELSKSVNGPELEIINKDDNYYLKSIRFESISTPEDIRNSLEELLALINGAAWLAIDARTPIHAVSIAQVREDGSRNFFKDFENTLPLRDTVDTIIVRGDGTVVPTYPADQVPGWIRSAQQNPNVAKVFRLLGAGNLDWVNLYRLYEIIKKDIGGIKEIAKRGWATKESLKRFKRTANSPDSIGDDARHGAQFTNSPKNPMALGEARSLLKVILHNWLDSM